MPCSAWPFCCTHTYTLFICWCALFSLLQQLSFARLIRHASITLTHAHTRSFAYIHLLRSFSLFPPVLSLPFLYTMVLFLPVCVHTHRARKQASERALLLWVCLCTLFLTDSMSSVCVCVCTLCTLHFMRLSVDAITRFIVVSVCFDCTWCWMKSTYRIQSELSIHTGNVTIFLSLVSLNLRSFIAKIANRYIVFCSEFFARQINGARFKVRRSFLHKNSKN